VSAWRGLASPARSDTGFEAGVAAAPRPKKSGRHPRGSPGWVCSHTWRAAAARLAKVASIATAHPLTLSQRDADNAVTPRKSMAANTLQR
jgi:hypothetical protein